MYQSIMPHIVKGLLNVEKAHECGLGNGFISVDYFPYSVQLVGRRVTLAEPELLLKQYVVVQNMVLNAIKYQNLLRAESKLIGL